MVPNTESFAQGVRVVELSLGVTLILGILTNLAAIASVGQSLSIMLSQGGVGFGTGLGAPEAPSANRRRTTIERTASGKSIGAL